MAIEVRQSAEFMRWFRALRDTRAADRIAARVRRLELGNPGDAKPVGEGVSEMRIDYGPGYRVYFTRTGTTVVILLCGGDKGSQARDIRQALQIARRL